MTITLPDDPALLSNVGSALRWRNEFDLAAECLNKALSLNLALGEAWNNRGQVHEDLGEFAEAMACYQNAYSLRPDHPNIALSLAYQRMRAGEWGNEPWVPAGAPEGTKEFPSTWSLWESGRQNYGTIPGIPIWQGEDLTGDRLLITPEGGFGDYIWLSRYLPKLDAMGAIVYLIVPDSLSRLADRRFPPCVVCNTGSTIPRPSYFDYQIPLLSLLTRFLRDTRNVPPVALAGNRPLGALEGQSSVTPSTATATSNRLSGEPVIAKNRQSDSPSGTLRIGCCFAAQEIGVQRPHRSIGPLALAPLREVPGVEWVSLMPDKRLEWMQPMQHVVGKRVVSKEWDWEDTARVIEQLDLVISVDTAVAHVAASLRVPTWILVPMRGDWKWQMPKRWLTPHPDFVLGYETSIWYPGARLFRQEHQTSWDSVIAGVCKELALMTQAQVTSV